MTKPLDPDFGKLDEPEPLGGFHFALRDFQPDQHLIVRAWLGALTRYAVPSHLWGGLLRYLILGIRPGGFLSACLTNDLLQAIQRADETVGADGIRAVMWFLQRYAPATSYGSPAKVETWIGSGPRGLAPME